jgi:hypothetical protein
VTTLTIKPVTFGICNPSLAVEENNMQFMLLIYQGPTPTLPGCDRWKALSESEQKAIYADYTDLNETKGITPGLPLGLPDAARTVQVHDGKAHVKNGPYLNECVGGYYLFEAESVEAAIDMAARVPAARLGGAVEIRPTEKYW